MNVRKIVQLMVICIVVISDIIRGQDIKPLIMCENETVTVSTGSSGVIKHIHIVGAPATTCSLIMTADIGSYMSIPEMERISEVTPCTNGAIRIDEQPYCVNKLQPGAIEKISNTKRSISITTSSNSPNFTLEFFNTVAVWGTDISIPGGVEVDRLSGIITSSYKPSFTVTLTIFTSTVTNLPSDVVRFDILSSFLGSRNKLTVDTQEVTDTTRPYLVNTTSREISIRYTPGGDDSTGDVAELVRFLIKFTVLTCGDVPQVLNTTSSTSTTPWFPGSKVTYTCKDKNYQLKKPVPTVECKVDNMEAKWVNQSEIKCIPVPYCLDGPYDVVYATYSIPNNHTATYQCIEGYEPKTEVISTCTSTNNDTKPWRWSAVSLNCTPVECKVEKLSLNPTTTIITSTGDSNGRYYYQHFITYECNFGYKKEDQKEEIHCQSDGTWSATPVCTQMAECSPDKLNITNGETDTRRYYRGDTLRYECDDGYKKSVDTALCQDTGNWSLTPECVVDESSTDSKVTTKGFDTALYAAIGGGVGALVVVSLVVGFVARRISHRPEHSSSNTQLNGDSPAEIGIENPYFELETSSDVISATVHNTVNPSDGAYDTVELEPTYAEVGSHPPAAAAKPAVAKKPMVKVKPTKKSSKPQTASNPNDIYAEVQSQRKPSKPSKPQFRNPDVVYEEAPMVPPKENEVELIENSLYESSPHAGQSAQSADGVAMIANDLYDTAGNVDMVANDLYDTAGNVDMVANDLYDTTSKY